MKHYLYASQMWRAYNCPGSVKATRRLKTKGEGTGEVQYGRELHRLTEEVITEKLELEMIDQPDREYVERCLNFLKGRDIKGETEAPLFVLVAGEMIASCRADLLSVNREAGEVVIPDWKFYRAPMDEAEWEWQALTMQAAALQEHKNCHVAIAVAYLPVLDRTYEYRLDRELLEETVRQIYETYEEANRPCPRLNPGPWCARCEALTTCPAAEATLHELATQANLEAIRAPGDLPAVDVMKRHFYSEIEKWSRGRFLGYLKVLPFLRPLLEALTDRLRHELAQGYKHTHWELIEKNSRRRGTVRAVRDVLGDLFTPDQIDDLCDPSFGRIKTALQRRGKSDREIAKLLAPFDRGKTKSLRRLPSGEGV